MMPFDELLTTLSNVEHILQQTLDFNCKDEEVELDLAFQIALSVYLQNICMLLQIKQEDGKVDPIVAYLTFHALPQVRSLAKDCEAGGSQVGARTAAQTLQWMNSFLYSYQYKWRISDIIRAERGLFHLCNDTLFRLQDRFQQ